MQHGRSARAVHTQRSAQPASAATHRRPTLRALLCLQAIPKDEKPWGRDAWGEPTPRPDDVGLAAEEEAKSWIAKREAAVARFRSGGPQVLPRDEDEDAEKAPASSWDAARGSPSSWDAGSSAIVDALAEAAANQ